MKECRNVDQIDKEVKRYYSKIENLLREKTIIQLQNTEVTSSRMGQKKSAAFKKQVTLEMREFVLK
ncbi:hypothetical protein D1632_10620 [Chryseobacterium nematophagum]|uniref:Uncharacterized protein n=1 Tax=Chryseobacterium nematophagum TaxID=2305228 RepID=A0A3M7LEU1_9FLAO|nr:hypothetical protein [Chryseobacterium nematophagum]RMZ60036.1 hypothetical protein D1632_10620 [Chryseobacterium nematophagum]